jgi:hypothetical protein
MNRFFRSVFLTVPMLALATGCAFLPNSRQFPAVNPHSKLLSGQVQYAGAKRSFVGDFTATVSDTDFSLDIGKGPGVSVISIRQSGGKLARVEAMGHSWQGNPRHAPKIVRNWLSLGDVLAGKQVPNARLTRDAQGLTAEFPETHERFVFRFNQPSA